MFPKRSDNEKENGMDNNANASMTQIPKIKLNNCVLYMTDGRTCTAELGRKMIRTKHIEQ